VCSEGIFEPVNTLIQCTVTVFAVGLIPVMLVCVSVCHVSTTWSIRVNSPRIVNWHLIMYMELVVVTTLHVHTKLQCQHHLFF